jgi:hypothetical protein
MSRFPHFLDNRLTDGSEVISLPRRPPFAPQEDSRYSSLLEADVSRPQRQLHVVACCCQEMAVTSLVRTDFGFLKPQPQIRIALVYKVKHNEFENASYCRVQTLL